MFISLQREDEITQPNPFAYVTYILQQHLPTSDYYLLSQVITGEVAIFYSFSLLKAGHVKRQGLVCMAANGAAGLSILSGKAEKHSLLSAHHSHHFSSNCLLLGASFPFCHNLSHHHSHLLVQKLLSSLYYIYNLYYN